MNEQVGIRRWHFQQHFPEYGIVTQISVKLIVNNMIGNELALVHVIA